LGVRDLMNQSKRKFHDRYTCQLICIYYTRNKIFHVLPTSTSHKNKTHLRKQTSFGSLCIHCTVQICHLWQHTHEKFGEHKKIYTNTFTWRFSRTLSDKTVTKVVVNKVCKTTIYYYSSTNPRPLIRRLYFKRKNW
jgi:hypothetical protein